MNSDPIVLTVNPGTNQFTFFQLIFGLTDYMLYDEAFPVRGDLAKAGFDKATYNDVRNLFHGEHSATVSFSNLTTIVQIADFIGKAMLNDIVSERLIKIYQRDFPDAPTEYEDMKAYVFSGATAFFKELKENFDNRPDILDYFQRLVIWKGWE